MTTKRWVLVDFDECPECGDDVEILTDCEEKGFFYDGDEARCCACHYPAQFSCDSETPGYISWHDNLIDSEYEYTRVD